MIYGNNSILPSSCSTAAFHGYILGESYQREEHLMLLDVASSASLDGILGAIYGQGCNLEAVHIYTELNLKLTSCSFPNRICLLIVLLGWNNSGE